MEKREHFINVRVPQTLKKRLQDAADHDRRSQSMEIEYLLILGLQVRDLGREQTERVQNYETQVDPDALRGIQDRGGAPR